MNRALLPSVLVFLLSFGLYLFTMVPALTDDDSGELAGAGVTLGTAHPPGYPLYSLTARAVVTLVPWGNGAYRVNLVSALCIAGAAAVIAAAGMTLTGQAVAAVALGLLYAFAGVVWNMANVTEVYGVAALIVSLLAAVVISPPSPGRALLAAYLCGLGLAAHYTAGLLLPGVLLWALPAFPGARERLRALTGALLFGALGFSVVVFLYLRAQADPLFGWEDPKTPERFWQVIARLRYGSLSLAQGGAPPLSPDALWQKLRFFFSVLTGDLTPAGLALFAAGLAYALKDRRRGWPLVLMLAAAGPGFLVMANVSVGPSSGELLRRFFFLPFIFAVLVFAFALKRFPALSVPALIIPAFLACRNLPETNRRHEFLFYDYGKNMLRTVPRSALLLSDRADEMEFTLAYLRLAGGQRRDIEFIDCNAGVTRSIYGDDYYRVWGKPRLEIRERVESRLIAETGRPVYYATFEPEMIAIPRRQEGLLFRAHPGKASAQAFPFGEIYALRRPATGEKLGERHRGLLLSHDFLLGRYYLETDNTGRADLHFRRASFTDDTGRTAGTIGFLYHRRGLKEQAAHYYRAGIAAGRADPELYTNLGAIEESAGNRGEAHRLYRQAIALSPAHVQAHFNLAVLFWREENWPQVVSELETVLRYDPRHLEAREYLATARARAAGNNRK